MAARGLGKFSLPTVCSSSAGISIVQLHFSFYGSNRQADNVVWSSIATLCAPGQFEWESWSGTQILDPSKAGPMDVLLVCQ